MKNKKIKIELNSLFGKTEADLVLIDMYEVPLMLTFGEELSKKALEEMKRIRKEKNTMNDIDDFCFGFCMASIFICENEEFVKAYKDRITTLKKEDKKDGV